MFRGDPTVYEPKGVRFYEGASAREMLLVNEPGHPNDGWLCWRHPDGQWVTERKATDVDRMQIASARDRAAQKRDPLREPITEEETLRARLAAAEERARRAEQALRGFLDVFWPTADEGHTGFVDRLGMQFYRETGIWPPFKSEPMEIARPDVDHGEASKKWRAWLEAKRDAAAAVAVAVLSPPPAATETRDE